MRSTLCALVLLGLVACARDLPEQAENAPQPYDLRAFPELAMPPGYLPSRQDDQVAMQIGGDLRLAQIVLVHEDQDRGPEDADAVRAWYASHLSTRGWQAAGPSTWVHQDRQERITLDTGRREKRTIIVLRLQHGL